jgi:hypothetical protein
MTPHSLASIAAVAALLSGCATTHDKYAWGSYDHSLYVYYKDPATVGALSQRLEATIKDADSTKAVVAPGIYAEYGYLLLQQGKAQDAIGAFQQEEKRWPESKVFMDRMIQVASSQAKTSSAKAP